MTISATNFNFFWAELIVEELIRNGVDYFVISPGSRSTPLTVAAASNPKARTTVHYDERGAAFFALGIAKALGKPCALICTSGTAVANYFPAIVEASMSCVPLVILTADRPPELQDTGANQTINQTRIYGEYVRRYVALPCPSDKYSPGYVLTTIDHAVYTAIQPPTGPVHVNCAFRGPLAPAPEASPVLRSDLGTWIDSQRPYTDCLIGDSPAAVSASDGLIRELNSTAKLLIIFGQDIYSDGRMQYSGIPHVFRRAVVFADATSSLRVTSANPTVANYDLLLQSPVFADLCRPDAVIHLGGALVSKRLQDHLASVRPRYYLRVANHAGRLDPHHCVTHRIRQSMSAFFASWTGDGDGAVPSDWASQVVLASDCAQKTVARILSSERALSEPAIANTIGELTHTRPEDALFIGNSMPIRDFDAYSGFLAPKARIVANRGASGIDGNIATAAGFSRASGGRVTAVIGDLAALHDLGSCALLRDRDVRLNLIIVNNNGGGIFHFLPIAEQAGVFEKYFGTPHGLHFEDAARMFGLPYTRPSTKREFIDAIAKARESDGSSITEVTTDRSENVRLHQRIADAVVKALHEL